MLSGPHLFLCEILLLSISRKHWNLTPVQYPHQDHHLGNLPLQNCTKQYLWVPIN